VASMIDVNISLGGWAFGELKYNTPGSMSVLMKSLGIDLACVSPLEAVLYHDVQTANQKLYRSIRRYRNRFLPFYVINPNYPGWENDLEECVNDLGAAGVRLLPNYHGYDIGDECCFSLLRKAGSYKLPVQIAPQVSDHRMHHPRVYVPPASLETLSDILNEFPKVRIAVINFNGYGIPKREKIRNAKNFFLDISWADGLAAVGDLADIFGVDKLLFGTNAPLMIPVSSFNKLKETDMSKKDIRKITRDNALRFLKGGKSK
jgi:uncharacterized protein